MESKYVIAIAVALLGGVFLGTLIESNARSTYSLSSEDKPSPSNWITKDQINVYQDKVVLDLQNAMWASFKDTNSMDPVIDDKTNSIELKPKKPSLIQVGDIISYNSKTNNLIITHRVIEINQDEQGWYAITKGDNNQEKDPEKVRFQEIEGIVVALLY